MPKIKITTLSPIHISSGNEFELNYNMLKDDTSVYLYDEFKIAEFFIQNNIEISTNLNTLKNNIAKYKNKIIVSNLHFRKIENSLNITKPLLSQVSSANKPIISGSSIKGAVETAIFSLLVDNSDRVENIKNRLHNQRFDERRFNDRKRPHTIDKDFKKIFTFLKFSDSYEPLKTKIYKTINIKKDKSKQEYREARVKQIENFVEAIMPNQSFYIDFKDNSKEYFKSDIFEDIGKICNGYYVLKINEDIKYYFYKKGSISKKQLQGLNSNKFILNIGRFGGAELKSIDNFRYIKNSKADDKNKTSARTFALDKSGTPPYFENELMPFGWILCEMI